MTSQNQGKLVRAVLTLMTASLIIIALQSLQWRMQHDSPHFLYSAYLMDQFGYIPYRDFADMNMPGCHILTLLLTKVFGYDDFGFRCSDLFCLAAILILTAVWTRRIGRYAAWFSAVAFGLIYLRLGSIISMQRDYLMLLPVSLSLVWLLSPGNARKLTTSFITGVLFGLCFLIKPTAAIGLPCLVGYQFADTRALDASQNSWVRTLLSMASFAFIGFAIPIAAMVWKLSLDGSLNDFLDVANNYWPLYNAISGELVVIPKLHTLIIYRINGYFQFGGFSLLLVPAVLGVFITLFGSGFDSAQRRVVVLISSLAVAYSLHTLMGGKFWPYQWIMFVYFVIVSRIPLPCLPNRITERNFGAFSSAHAVDSGHTVCSTTVRIPLGVHQKRDTRAKRRKSRPDCRLLENPHEAWRHRSTPGLDGRGSPGNVDGKSQTGYHLSCGSWVLSPCLSPIHSRTAKKIPT